MDASQLRLKARESLKGNYWTAVGVAFVAAIFGALMTTGGSFSINIEKRATELIGDLPTILKTYLMIAAGGAGALSLVNLILGGVIQIGYAQYLLKQQDREINSVKDLFSQFDRFGQGFLQLFLRIPGLVKSFAYAMTPFLMTEDPTLTANEAIKLSQEKMRGHKGELFWLGLTFFGWSLLAVLTGGVGYIFLNPYVNAAYAAFYRDKISPKAATVSYTCIDAQN